MVIELEVGEKSVKFVEGVAKFIKKSHASVVDGWTPGTDLPAIAMAAFQELVPVLGTLSEVRDELQSNEDSQAIIAALLINEIRDLVK